jgi:predicted component of type VI protein secretion system
MRPVNPDAHHNAIVFEIRGELQAEPNPVPLYLTTEVNLEDGDARVSEPSVGDKR